MFRTHARIFDQSPCAVGRVAAVVDTSTSGRRVARELTALLARSGKRRRIVSDHGTESTSDAMPARSEETGMPLKIRDGLLNEMLFFAPDHAREAVARWIAVNNLARAHTALVYRTPVPFAARLIAHAGSGFR